LKYILPLIVLLSSCASSPKIEYDQVEPLILDTFIRVGDGTELAVTKYMAEEPRAILIALHGMNDYAKGFESAAQYWSDHDISVYAYDQRGFGRSPGGGKWPGDEALVADLQSVVSAVKKNHPSLPVYVIGHSMGGAVVMMANGLHPLDVDGILLAAPATWGGRQMPVFYRMVLKLATTFAPGKTLTGKRARRQATDHIEILRGMQKDPLVIKETRIDAVAGLTQLMGKANSLSTQQSGRIFYFYGCKDEMFPRKTLEKTRSNLYGNSKAINNQKGIDITSKVYAEGWHLLFRDLQAENVWRDSANWILQKENFDGHADGHTDNNRGEIKNVGNCKK